MYVYCVNQQHIYSV